MNENLNARELSRKTPKRSPSSGYGQKYFRGSYHAWTTGSSESHILNIDYSTIETFNIEKLLKNVLRELLIFLLLYIFIY